MRSILVLVALCLSVAAATLLQANSPLAVPNQYIVVLHPFHTATTRDAHIAELISNRFTAASDRILHRYNIGSFIAYSAVLSKATLARELAHANVAYIEADQIVTANADDYGTQTGATWGIDRVDQASLPLNQTYRYYNSSGAGVTAYIIDTGIRITHNEFAGGRATFGFNAITNEAADDLNGHGTHVAGTVGGSTYGVAKKVTLVAVKVLAGNGSGTTAGVISGIDYATKAHQGRGKGALSVANMSLGGGASLTLDNAVNASIAAGVTYAVAAGNDNANACNYSPARVAAAVSVGATTNTDARASFSNYGTCVHIFAPGQNILSSWYTSNTATNTISGTSMATPHVVGVLAVHLGHHLAVNGTDAPVPTPAANKAWLLAVGTKDKVTNPGTGSPNNLLFSPYA